MADVDMVTVVTLQWEDAALHSARQFRSDDTEFGLVYGIAAGILVREDDRTITLAMDLFPHSEQSDYDNYRTCATYPKSGIRNLWKRKVTMHKLPKEPADG